MRLGGLKINCNKNALLALFVFISMLSGYSQTGEMSYDKKYRLDFSLKSDTAAYFYITNSAYAQPVRIPFIAKDHKSGELFTPNHFYTSMRCVMRTSILLPDMPERKQGDISLEVKGRNLESLSMMVQGLDYREKVLFNDTVSFVPDTVYSKLCCDFPAVNAEMLDVTIDVKGKENSISSIIYSNIEIKIDGQVINNMPVRSIPDVVVDKKHIIPINEDSDIPLSKIKSLRGKKIIGIGESVHKHYDINSFVYRLMEESIKGLGCRLLVVEIPIEKSLFYNRYISDSSFVLPQEQMEYVALKNYMPFFDTLRRHNAKCSPEERVMLLGMDYNTETRAGKNSLSDLFDFVCALNNKKPMREVDRLAVMLYDNKPSEALEYIKCHRQELENVLTSDELKCIEHILSFSTKISADSSERIILRDSMMMENISFMERNFASDPDCKIIAYGHAVHLNYLSVYPVDNLRSAGNYLHERYGDLYGSFFVTTDRGYVHTLGPEGSVYFPELCYPCDGSIEKVLSHTVKTSCYLPVTKEYDRIVMTRAVVAIHIKDKLFTFYPVNLYQRYDGVFYVKALEALSKPEEDSSKMSFDEKMRILEEKVENERALLKKKKSLADEIRNRCK